MQRPVVYVSKGIRAARDQAAMLAAIPEILGMFVPRRCHHGHDPVPTADGPICRRCHRQPRWQGNTVRWVR